MPATQVSSESVRGRLGPSVLLLQSAQAATSSGLRTAYPSAYGRPGCWACPEPLPRQVDLPFNALTVLLSPPDDIYVLSAPFDSFRCWRIMFHEFGHFLHGAYNLQPGYLSKWEESPCFQEGMAQTISHFLLRPEVAAALFDDNVSSFIEDQRRIDACRCRIWLASARDEIALYRDAEDPPRYAGHSAVRVNGIHREEDSSFADCIYFIFHPFHFENMLIGDLVARTIHKVLPVIDAFQGNDGSSAHWLCDNFYGDGSTIDWRRRLDRAAGAAIHTLEDLDGLF